MINDETEILLTPPITALSHVFSGILLAHAVSAALKARPKFKIATTSTTTTSTTEEAHVEESDGAYSEVRIQVWSKTLKTR